MLSGWIFIVYLISHGYITNASFDEKETKYFVNKELNDETRKIDDKLQRLKLFNDLQCESSKTKQTLNRLGGPDACQVKPHSKPWVVAMKHYDPSIDEYIIRCGGTLISKRVVLTAAHCICDHTGNCNRSSGRNVTIGEHNINKIEVGEQVIQIEATKAHKDFNDVMSGYDVALIFLKEDAVLNDHVQLASLPQNNQHCPPGNSLTLCGWGRDPLCDSYVDPNCPERHSLWAVKQECLDIGECDRFGSLKDPSIILCVGDKTDPRNSGFHGDSGGPLTFSDDCGKRTIFGIVSGPGNNVSSGVSETTAFARVSHPRILDWIRNTMNSYFK